MFCGTYTASYSVLLYLWKLSSLCQIKGWPAWTWPAWVAPALIGPAWVRPDQVGSVQVRPAWACLPWHDLQEFGLHRHYLPSRGLPWGELPGCGLPEHGLPGRGLPGSDLPLCGLAYTRPFRNN